MQVVGEGRCPIVDTWWQTETGAAMITPLPFAWDTKPGSATLPFFGVQPVLLTDKGEEISGPGGHCAACCPSATKSEALLTLQYSQHNVA